MYYVPTKNSQQQNPQPETTNQSTNFMSANKAEKSSRGSLWMAFLIPTLLFAAAIGAYLYVPKVEEMVQQNLPLVAGIGGGLILLLAMLWFWLYRRQKRLKSTAQIADGKPIKEETYHSKRITTGVKFGTFQGVFTPAVLTILGVIMYLREGWVVGNAGLLGAIGVILLACTITFFTALSMSSITTNIRIGAGGAFSIIAQSLGLEAGGAIGIPLYFSQALAVAMYIFGFREGWNWIFPEHPTLIVDMISFALVFLIVNISTDFAFKLQYIIMAIIFGSLISICGALFTQELNYNFEWFGSYPGSPETGFKGGNFWIVFAVYFPAVTGIMAGANMSGDLKNPRKSIPVGTLSAIILSTIVYLALAVVLALLATPKELVSNYNILIDKALWAPIVLAGLLGATFSSALSSLVGAPRILAALGEHKILFFNDKLTQVDSKGEPRTALLITVVIVFAALLLRNLNAIAPLITMFFMITYAMINVVVLVEQSLGQVSFRPTLKVPFIVPLLGALGCFFVMFIINPIFGLISIGIVLAAYALLVRKKLETLQGDTRSGIFNALAAWSARVVNKLPEAKERSWQPNLLIPVQGSNDLLRAYKVIYSLVNPKGSIKILGFTTDDDSEKSKILSTRLDELGDYFMQQDISARAALVQSPSLEEGVKTSMQSLKAAFFRPNILFLSLTDSNKNDEITANLMRQAHIYGMGAMLFVPYRKVGLGLEKTINLWVYFNNLDPKLEYRTEHINLAILSGYLLQRNWNAKWNVITVLNPLPEMSGDREKERAQAYMKRLQVLARLPERTNFYYVFGEHYKVLDKTVPKADLNMFSLRGDRIDIQRIRERVDSLETSCLFLLDSGLENALV